MNPYETAEAPLLMRDRAEFSGGLGLTSLALSVIAILAIIIPVAYVYSQSVRVASETTVNVQLGMVIGLGGMAACMLASAAFALGTASLILPCSRRLAGKFGFAISGLFLLLVFFAMIAASMRLSDLSLNS